MWFSLLFVGFLSHISWRHLCFVTLSFHLGLLRRFLYTMWDFQRHSYISGYPVVLDPIVEKRNLLLDSQFSSTVPYTFISVPCCFGHHHFVVSFELSSLSLTLFFHEFQNQLVKFYLQRRLQGFWHRVHDQVLDHVCGVGGSSFKKLTSF